MPAWDCLVLRFWSDTDGVRGRVLRVDGRQVAAFSSAREAGDAVERLISAAIGPPARPARQNDAPTDTPA